VWENHYISNVYIECLYYRPYYRCSEDYESVVFSIFFILKVASAYWVKAQLGYWICLNRQIQANIFKIFFYVFLILFFKNYYLLAAERVNMLVSMHLLKTTAFLWHGWNMILHTSTLSFYISRKIMSSVMRIFYAMIPLVKSVTQTLNLNPLYLIRCT
jgi:hypothetical protein